MAFVVVRVAARVKSASVCSLRNQLQTMCIANITSAGGHPRPKTYKTFNYRTDTFPIWKQPFDRSHKRFDQNSRVIVIDGPMASGKHEFAKRLAKQLDFKFVPQADVNNLYKVGETGLTYKDLDDLLPEKFRIYDQQAFYSDSKPKLAEGGGRVGWLQIEWFTARLYTYNDALLHLFSTGQGVVCVRSPWSDRVFAKALLDNGYMSKAGFGYYETEIAMNHICDFPRPHLTIYLDADVETTKRNIKKRATAMEMNTKVLTDNYLKSIEDEYKNNVLPSLESHGELLVYPAIPDITDHEVELMVEDIEALGPMTHSGHADDHHLEDWANLKDEEMAFRRRQYQDLHLAHKILSHTRPWSCPEMCQDEYFVETRARLYNYLPGWKYEQGSDPDLVPWWKIALGLSSAPSKSNDRRLFWIPA